MVIQQQPLTCSSATIGSVTCTSDDPASDTLYNYIRVAESLCSTSADCPAGTTLTLQVTAGLKNPSEDVPQKDSFTLQVKSTGGYGVLAHSESLVASPALKVGEISDLSIAVAGSAFTGQDTELTLSFRTSSNVPLGGRIIAVFPAGMLYPSRDTGTEPVC